MLEIDQTDIGCHDLVLKQMSGYDSNTNELLARTKFLLVNWKTYIFAYRIANRVGVLSFLGGVMQSFSLLTYMLVRPDEYFSLDGGH